MLTPSMSDQTAQFILQFLGVNSAPPSLALLEQINAAYVRRIPWESAFRIAKRARSTQLDDCPRWPEEFWQDVMNRGGGGTCFESNYALFALLTHLGFSGYPTINNMGDTVGCHSAIIIQMNGEKWLVDVGLPLYAPIKILPDTVSQRETPFFTYAATPIGSRHYEIERSPHPSPNCFTLIDEPVDDQSYRDRTTRDYEADGFFLDKVVISRIVDETMWRFNSAEPAPVLQHFSQGVRTDTAIKGDTASILGSHFSMDSEVIRTALAVLDI